MEKKEIAQQVKVGAFVLTGLTLFLISVFLIGSQNNIFSRTFTLTAVFRNVEGLKPGDNVWLSGVKIGTVSDVRIVSDGRVIVDLSLKHDQNQFIRRDAVATIGSDGIVGSKILIIRPGISNEIVSEADTLRTTSPPDTQDILNVAKQVGDNTRSITSDLKVIASSISEGEGVLGELLNDGALSQEIRAVVANLRTTGSNTVRASEELHRLVYALREGDGLLPTLIADTSYVNTFRSALTNIETLSADAGAVSQKLRSFAARIDDTDNPVGVLLSDSVAAEELKATIQNAASASRKLDENMEALQHNFLFRGYFRKQEKRERERREAASSRSGD